MHMDTGLIYDQQDIDEMSKQLDKADAEERRLLQARLERLTRLDEEEHKAVAPLAPRDRPARLLKLRKNKNRNRPCLCLSGKKFKHCCWNKTDAELMELLNSLSKETLHA